MNNHTLIKREIIKKKKKNTTKKATILFVKMMRAYNSICMGLLLNKTKWLPIISLLTMVHLIMITEKISIDAIVNILSFCFMHINYNKQLQCTCNQ